MADVFISYANVDGQLADFMRRRLKSEGLSVFLAPVSLEPGKRWTPQIFNALKTSKWLLFLASRKACASAYVQQELGAAMIIGKNIVPIVWDMPLSQLPGWASQYQAVTLAGTSTDDIVARLTTIADRIKADKANAQLIGGILLAAFVYFASRS